MTCPMVTRNLLRWRKWDGRGGQPAVLLQPKNITDPMGLAFRHPRKSPTLSPGWLAGDGSATLSGNQKGNV
jgi:hypothetical protein